MLATLFVNCFLHHLPKLLHSVTVCLLTHTYISTSFLRGGENKAWAVRMEGSITRESVLGKGPRCLNAIYSLFPSQLISGSLAPAWGLV